MRRNADDEITPDPAEDLARRFRRVAEILAAGAIRAAARQNLDDATEAGSDRDRPAGDLNEAA